MHSSDFKRILAILSLILILSYPGYSQATLSVNFIGGNYSMTDLKRVQQFMTTGVYASPVALKNTMNFPVSIQGEAEFRYLFHSGFAVGASSNYSVTRGKSGYADYSGEISTTQNVSRITHRALVSQVIRYGISFDLKAGLCFSRDEIVQQLDLNGSPGEKYSTKFHSFGYSVQPGFSWQYKLRGRYSLQAQAGYEFNRQGDTISDSDSKLILLQPARDSHAKINWSGFRLGAGIGYTF